MLEGKEITHPSFGMIQISRVSCGGQGEPLFGSAIKHNVYFELSIHHGRMERDLSHDWYFQDHTAPIIEVALSPMQLIEMISAMNIGNGVQCTLRSIDGKDVEQLTFDDIESESTKARSDFKDDVKHLSDGIPELIKFVKSLRDKHVKKLDIDEIVGRLNGLAMHINENMPFVQDSFDKKIEKSQAEAQASIDALFTDLITRLGIGALQDMYGKQLVSTEELKPMLVE